MSSIDERIVEMKFNNAQFESGIKKSLDSLDSLNKGLNVDGEGLGRIASAVENVSNKFSVLGAVGASVIFNLVNSAMGFGKKIVSQMLDPLVEGGKKRALNIEQAKFQFEGLGMDVEATMASALAAVTGTAFGLDEAAVAAANFGATGMKAGDEMTAALRGISGVASMSGSSYSDVADIFSKVAGQGRLMGDDLNRLASRGINAAATLAKQMGITEAEVRSMVSKGKIGFEDFAASMNDAFGDQATKANETYSGSLSNMRAALARIGAAFAGPMFEKKRDIFNSLTPVIDNVAKAIKPLIDMFTQLYALNGDRLIKVLDNLNLDGLTKAMPQVALTMRNLFNALGSVLAPLKDAFREIFPPASADTIKSIAVAIKQFSARLVLSEAAADKLKRSFKGVFAIFSIGWTIIKAVASIFAAVFGEIFKGSGSVLDLTARLGDFLVGLDQSIKKGEKFSNFFEKTRTVIDRLREALRAAREWVVGLFTGATGGEANIFVALMDRVKERLASFAGLGKMVSDAFSKITSSAGEANASLNPIVESILGFLKGLGTGIADALRNADFSAIGDVISVGLIATIALMIKKFMSGGFSFDLTGGLADSIKGVFGSLTDTLGAMQAKLKSDILVKIATAVGILAASAFVLAMVDSVRLAAASAALTLMFTELMLAMKIFTTMVTVKDLGKLPVLASGMILVASALLIMAGALRMLSGLSWEEMLVGLSGVTGLLVGIVGFTKMMAKSNADLTALGVSLIVMGIGLKVFASALKDFAEFSWEDIIKGFVGVAGALGALAIFSKMAALNKAGMEHTAGLVLLAIALKIIASAIGDFASMEWEALIKGFLAMGIALGAVAVAMKFMEGTVAGASALVIAALAMGILSRVMVSMGGMSWEEIAKSLVLLAGSLVVLAGGLYLMTGAIAGSAALIIAAGALAILAPVLVSLGGLSWGEILKGLVALAGTFLVLGLAGLVLTPVVPLIILLAAAIGLIGIGTLAAGAGVLAFATGLTVLSAAGTAGALALGILIETIIGLIPKAMTALGEGIVAFAGVISNAGPTFVAAMVTLIGSLVTAINITAPKVIKTLVGLVLTLITVLAQNVPKFVDRGLKMVAGILEGIGRNMGRIIDAATKIITEFINGISRNIPKIVQSGINLIINFVDSLADGIRRNQPRMERAGQNLASAIVSGMVKGITGGASKVITAAKDMAKNAFESAKNFLQINSPSRRFMPLGSGTAEGYSLGIVRSLPMVRRSASRLGETAFETLRSSIKRMSALGVKEIDVRPKITPVLDLSNVQKGARQLDGMFATDVVTAGSSYNKAATIANDHSRRRHEVVKSEFDNGLMDRVTFIQNNNSPVALSRVEIYRQTRNQLSAAKGALIK